GAVVLHRDDLSLAEANDSRRFSRPFRTADLARVRRDDHHLGSGVVKGQPSFGEAGGLTLAQRAHHVVAAVAVPVSWLEPAPLDVLREDRLARLEVAAAPSVESLVRDSQARAVTGHVHPRSILVAREEREE